jgi:mono/diheme cytochrome c family protein
MLRAARCAAIAFQAAEPSHREARKIGWTRMDPGSCIALLVLAGLGQVASDAAATDFARDIRPIFEDHCIDCHGPRRQRGGLRLDGSGGVFHERPGEWVIRPGRPDESELVRRIGLPADHDDLMPSGGEPLDAALVERIRRWVAEGAAWPEPEAHEAGEDEVVLEPPSPEARVAAERAAHRLRQRGAAALPVARDSIAMEVDFSRMPGPLEEADLRALRDMAPVLVRLDLAGTAVEDTWLEHLEPLEELRVLRLERTQVGDEGLRHLAPLSRLRRLSLYGTRVTDAGLDHLHPLDSLRRLYVWRSGVSEAGATRLCQALPRLVVVREASLPDDGASLDPAPRPLPVCCATARAAGGTCAHACCVAAAARGAVCPTCPSDPNQPPPDVTPVDFNRDVRPILAEHCLRCHGPDAAARQASLRLDRFDDATAPRPSGGRAIAPGDPAASLLLARVSSSDERFRMPPADAGAALPPAHVEILRRWIAQGARYEEHWSFVPPRRPEPPAVARADWPRQDLDRFVLARLEREGLAPSPAADRATYIRRVSLDLIGLPPAPEEVAAFVRDADPDAERRLVDRLLASPHFGERWAAVWLDLARYADTRGYEADRRRTMWPYRDWVIRAFAEDLPFDRFTVEQIAGDLLPGATVQQVVATAFHRNTMTNDEGGTDDEEFRSAAVVDRVNTTAQVWMGLTAGCAQCHAHKYDPISHEEYYRLYAFFNQTADADRPDETPLLELPGDAQRSRLEELARQVADLTAAPPGPERDAALAALGQEEAQVRGAIPALPVMRALPPAERRESRVHLRGDFMNPGAPVQPGVPEAFHPLRGSAGPTRLDLAHWLVDRANPLTARVHVNRVWEQFFGAGLVETTEDLGTRGEPPSHPELLDWLAVEFMERGWSHKAICRLIAESATYRQASSVTPDVLERDPYNRLLARGPRFRLGAEALRDQALAAAGLLDRAMYGPPVFPPQPEGLWQVVYSDDRWHTATGSDRHRRALYTFWRRTTPYPSMSTFDAPSREVCVSRRIRTNTPLQALAGMNDPVLVEAAQALARRIMVEADPDPAARAAWALRLCLCRDAAREEVAALAAFFDAARARLALDPEGAARLATDPLGPAPPGVDPVELAAWTAVCNLVMNLDEFLTRL